LRRAPAYISAATQSIKIDVKPHLSPTSVTGFPITANLTASSAGCTSTLTATVCDVGLALAPGNYDATLTTFDLSGGAGNQLSAAQSMPLNVAEGQANTVPLALGGIPASVQLLASGGQVAAGQGFVFTLPANATGTLSAFGVDADGNTIVGAGAPSISAATSDATQIAVTQPLPAAPNAIGLASQGASTIAHITVTVTPVAGTGSSAVSRTVTVQAPTLSLFYLATGTSVRIIDATGTVVTQPGTAFASIPPSATGMAYDSANGLLYIATQSASSSIVAYDRNGNSQPLAAGASGISLVFSLAYDPADGLIYAGNNNVAFDAGGNTHALNSTIAGTYAMTYDPQHNLIVSGTQTYDASGNAGSSLSFAGQVVAITYNPANGFFYVATVYPTAVNAYDTSGNPQVLSGSFTVGGGEQIAGIGADPATGNIFLSTNGNNTYGFDRNGNNLGLPWHNLVGVGAPLDVAGIALLPPQ